MSTVSTVSPRLAAAALRVELVDSLDAIAAHEQPWNELALRAIPHRPMLSAAWVLSVLDHRAGDVRPRCAFAWHGDRLVGVLPLVLLGRHGRCSPADMEHTLSGGPLLDAADAAPIWNGLLDAHWKDKRPRPHLVKVQGVLRGDPLDRAISSGSVRREAGVRGARLSTREPFETLQARLGSKTRSRLRAANRKLESLGTIAFESYAGDEALARLDEFVAIEASGWKGRAHTNISGADTLQGFYRTLVRRLADAGWLRIDLLRAGANAAAGQLCIQLGQTCFVQKIAYDERLAKYSPGHLLWERFVRRCCADEGTDAIDTIGTDHIRERWKCEIYDYDDLYFFATGLGGSLARGRTRLRAALGRAARRWRERQAD